MVLSEEIMFVFSDNYQFQINHYLKIDSASELS